jgi:transcriptional regulator with PAS, ATPase and Fis domain
MGPLIIANIIIGSVCSTVALLHLVVFLRRQDLKANLFFAIMSMGAAGSALSEAWVYRATTVEAFNTAFKVQITFQGMMWISLIWFIMVYTGMARRLLAIALTAAYALAVIINVISPFGLIYSKITALHSVTLPWGELITYATGTANPWRFIADIAWVFLLFLVIESCVRLYRHGQKRRAIILCSSILLFLGLAYLHATLMDMGIVGPPGIISFGFIGLILVMSASLVEELVRASVLSREVKAKEQKLKDERERMDVILSALNTGLALINPDMTVAWVNEKIRSMLPWDDPVGKKCYVFAENRTEPCEGCGAIQAFTEGHVHETERLNSISGRWVHIISLPIKDETGRVVNVLESTTDITERKQAEIARDEAMKELEVLKSRLEEENIYLREEIQSSHGFTEIIGESNALLYVLSRVKQVADTDATVLVHGETGVGKELISRAIHKFSSRSEKSFIKMNCSALPPNLVESELFGHEKGAFTGATRLRKGRFELADGGSLFMDEVSELPPEVQAKLLRVLQDGEFERVGGSHTITSDVRVIAATNRNLSEEVAAGRFRADLFYRLNVYPITVPPLRNRRGDIPLLVQHFVSEIAARVGKTIDQIPPYVMEQLTAYDWPGNVRELKNVLERSVITSQDTVLRLPQAFREDALQPSSDSTDSWESLDEVQRRYVLKVLKKTKGQIEGPGGASEILQLKPSTLRSRLQKLRIRGKNR